MNENALSTSKRLKTETNREGESPSVAVPDQAAGSHSSESTVFISEDCANTYTFVNIFTDDILPEIFDNLEILSTEDLLNFRLVNRCWRDASTSVLLKRNVTQISLDFGKVTHDEDSGAGAQVLGNITPRTNKNDTYKFFQSCHPKSNLTELSHLMTYSPKFPSNSIYLQSECNTAFGNLCPTSNCVNGDEHLKDFFNFLSLHGNKMRKLTLSDGISQKAIQNLLYVHMPRLTCLDIQRIFEFSSQNETDAVNLPHPSTLKLQEIFMPYRDQGFDVVKELISFSPNLSAIDRVHTSGLGIMLETGKFQFMKELYMELIVHDISTRDELSQFLRNTVSEGNVSRLHLSKLTVGYLDDGRYNDTLQLAQKVLNIILSASKDYLQYLTIHFQSSQMVVNIFIPSLPYLESLALHDYENEANEIFAETKVHFVGDVIGGAVEAHQSLDDLDTLSWPNSGNINIPAGYFPRLYEVNMDLYELKNNPAKLTQFFALDHLGPDGLTIIPGDTLSTVTTLNLDYYVLPMYEINIANLFPNVSNLKINCAYSTGLRNWVWTALPKLGTFTVFGIVQGEDHNTNFVDSFFTGFSPEDCAQLGSNASCTELESFSPRVYERTQPFIGDCKNLKEFHIQFGKELNSKFVSKVTAVYGFKEVIHRTKIIFWFPAYAWSLEKIQETRQNFKHISAYVEIQMDT